MGDFQRHGCLANPGPGNCQPHTHNISGTLHCNPETGRATLNINLLGLATNDTIQWPLSSPPRSAEHSKWNGSTNLSSKETMPYSVYSAPVSPPSLPQDVPPPLLDFTQEQLMTDILNMDMDPQKEEFNSHIPYSDSPPVSLPAPLPLPRAAISVTCSPPVKKQATIWSTKIPSQSASTQSCTTSRPSRPQTCLASPPLPLPSPASFSLSWNGRTLSAQNTPQRVSRMSLSTSQSCPVAEA